MTAVVQAPPGVYALEGFLDRETCALVRDQMRAGGHARAKVYDREWNYSENAGLRSTLQVEVSRGLDSLVRERLLGLREELGRRFRVEVGDCEGPTFLIYKPGDFFEPHKDESDRPGAPEHVRRRQVSAVIFLSDEESPGRPGDYAGGSLCFYGLLKDPRCARIGIPVRGSAGLLVAFRSDVFHQVTPVTRGERLTAVAWYA